MNAVRCPACGYDVSHAVGWRCSECGKSLEGWSESVPSRHGAPWRWPHVVAWRVARFVLLQNLWLVLIPWVTHALRLAPDQIDASMTTIAVIVWLATGLQASVYARAIASPDDRARGLALAGVAFLGSTIVAAFYLIIAIDVLGAWAGP